MGELEQGQIIRVHGPYEDLGIALCKLAEKVIEGQSPEVKAELWRRHLEVTKPLHELAVSAMGKIEQFFRGGK